MQPNTRAVLTRKVPGARRRSGSRTSPPSPRSRTRAEPASSSTTPGRRRSSFSPHAHGVDPGGQEPAQISVRPRGSAARYGFGRMRPGSSGFTAQPGLIAIPPGAEDVFLALRGLRTMDLRLREAERQGLALAQWLTGRPEVLRVIHPALPDDPGHGHRRDDFPGSSGPVFGRAEAGVGRRGRQRSSMASNCSRLGYSLGERWYESLAVFVVD